MLNDKIEYVIATQAIENIVLSDEVLSLCEKIQRGNLTGDEAVEHIISKYRKGDKSGVNKRNN